VLASTGCVAVGHNGYYLSVLIWMYKNGTERMSSLREKGKIDSKEWASILSRHEQGESLASIARSYSCTAPAIRYIVKRMLKLASPEATSPVAKAETKEVSSTGSTPVSLIEHHLEKELPASEFDLGGFPKRIKVMSTTPFKIEEPDISDPPNPRWNPFDGDFVDQASGDIAAFLVALDMVSSSLDDETMSELRRATNRIMKVGARTRTELDKLTSVAPIGKGKKYQSN
jgi:hypothetical protein